MGFRLILRRLFVNIIRLCRLYGLFDIIFGLNRLIRFLNLIITDELCLQRVIPKD